MIAYFARHPTVANLLMMALLLLGITSIGSIKRETFPEFQLPVITASVVWPGASPEDVEQSLCQRMEDAVDGLSNIEEVRCEARESLATLTMELTSDASIERMLLDTQTKINAIQDFPDQTEAPVVQEQNWADPVVDIAITADTDLTHLKAYAEQLKQRLKTEAGIKLVTIQGFSDHQIRIELNPDDVRRFGLTIADVADKIARQNVQMPAGTLELKDKNLLVRFDEQKMTADQLAELIVSASESGGVIRLKDIATITDRFENDEDIILFNGYPAAVLKIQKNKADDILRIREQIEHFVSQAQLTAPDGVTLTLTNDMSSLVDDRLGMMLKNGWQGIILVFLSMWLFFSLRYSFWVSAGLPVAFMGGLFLMSLMGLSINMMSLVALLMAIGIMMDDAIVIAESIAAFRDRGHDVDEAVVLGVKKVLPGVISSFLTTVSIFGALLWLDGQMGAVLAVVPMVLILVLTVSLLEAFLILPNHLHHSLSAHADEKPDSGLKQAFLKHFDHFRTQHLVRIVSALVQWRYATLGGTIGLLLIAISMLAGGTLKFAPFPELDGDIAEARIILPPGTPLSETRALVNHITQQAEQVARRFSRDYQEPDALLQSVTTLFNTNTDAGEKGTHLATVRLDLLSAEIRRTSINDFIQQWRQAVGEQAHPLSMVFTQPSLGPAGRDIEIRLQHQDLQLMKAASVEVQSYLAGFSGTEGLLDDMRPGKQEVLIRPSAGAESYGVDGLMIASQLRGAFLGQTADEIQVGPENIEIEVRLNKASAGDLNALMNFPIIRPDGAQIPLSAIAHVDYQRSFVRIERIDGVRSLTIMGNVDNNKANSTEILNAFTQHMKPELERRYPGLKVSLQGSAEETSKTGQSFAKGFIVGLFGLFAILSFQFRSYLEPFVVMLAIPMALIGVIFGHLLLGYNLSMPSMMGFISLAGIVVNDSILLVQYIRFHVDQGDNVHQAVVSASKERFRAVFLTSITTAAGLLPLLLETSLQAQVVQPLVVSIVFGLMTSTLLVLLVIPCAYAVLADFNLVHPHKPMTQIK
ncbi:efflux RND transporter permease subunit [Oceanospirillum sediminis]|uniref:Efflux RND transporter permease subunit n=1 Tax=Oceanospirillum sediminis TaxID=2760088 RepID=A0A839IVW8_9GAMM|nr:efflux RND transporter permease subunit [Oceanospirillum sediminis]MBB1488527.1 efflux RND transporter permease subunit [Oceanospirillum sediminis]